MVNKNLAIAVIVAISALNADINTTSEINSSVEVNATVETNSTLETNSTVTNDSNSTILPKKLTLKEELNKRFNTGDEQAKDSKGGFNFIGDK